MGSASTESLPTLLLRLSEAGEKPILWGNQARPHFGRDFDRLLRTRILIEDAPANAWPPCNACECGLDARPIEEIDGHLVAVCPDNPRDDVRLTPDDVRSFRIDVAALVHLIAQTSGLTDGPTTIADSVWNLGYTPSGRAAVLVLNWHALFVQSFFVTLRASVRASPITTILPERTDLRALQLLTEAGVHATKLQDAFSSVRLFTVDTSKLEPTAIAEPSLVVQRAAKAIVLFGRRLALPDRSFRLMDLFARSAAAGARVVNRLEIEQELWGNRPVDKRSAADAVRDLREQIAGALPPSLRPATFIANRSGQGYVLELHGAMIRFDP